VRVAAAVVALLLTAWAASGWAPYLAVQSPSGGSGDYVYSLPNFDSIHYIAPSGCSNSYNGLSPTFTSGSNGPWCNVNHALNCGDVVIAQPGTYNGTFVPFGAVSNCPSTSGGIDGTGGIYFAVLLCGGTDLGTNGCIINCATAACSSGVVGSGGRSGISAAMNLGQNYWAIEGWTATGNGASHQGFQVDSCLTITTVVHHIAFINDIVYNAGQGYDTDDCGYGANPTYSNGPDYWAVVGSIAQNASQNTICLGAVDAVGVSQLDSGAGTHIYFYGNFSYAHVDPSCRTVSDTEDYMFDTWDRHNVSYQGVIANNIGFGADRMCIQLFEQSNFANIPTIKVYNNTCFRDNLYSYNDWADGEIQIQSTTANITWIISITNNIAYQPNSANGNGTGTVWALTDGPSGAPNGLTISGNVFKGNNSSCRGTYCNSGFDAVSWQSQALINGAATYVNPAFTNTADLLANQAGVPNCTGFTTTTACMGWNAVTSTLTTPSIISDLTPTAGGTAGKGYQLPSTICAANADYPTWLKGVVYLQWNSGTHTITEKAGLVTKPCGM